MAENQIEIEVTLDAKQAKKGLESLEETGAAVGESLGAVGESVTKIGGQISEEFGVIGESASGVVDSFISLGESAKESGASFISLIGPIGAVVVGIIELAKAFHEYSEAAKESEIRVEAYKAATAEMTTIIEELAAAQVSLTEKQIKELQILSMQAKIPIETAQGIRASNAERAEEINLINQSIEWEKKRHKEHLQQARFQIEQRWQDMTRVIQLLRRREKLQKKIEDADLRAIKLGIEGARRFGELEKVKERHLERSLVLRQELLKKELELVEQAQLQILSFEATTLEGQRKLLDAQFMQRMRKVNKMLKEEKITREGYKKILEGMTAEHNAKVRSIEETDRQKRLARYRAYQAKRLAAEKQLASEQARIRQLEIDRMRINGATEIEVLEAQYEEQAKLAGKNQNLQLIAQMQFENQRLKLQKNAERKRQEDAKQAARDEAERAKQRQEFIFDSMEFDLNLLSDGTDKELQLLELRYERELRLREHSEEEITELARRHSIERERLIEAPMHMAIEQSKEMAKSFSDGFAIATYNALLFGDSFKESVGEVLVGLGRQASVEALMETAKGTAALFLNPVLAASHFKAASVFGVAALAAGQAGKSLGGGSMATPPTPSTSAGGGSPTGSPQTATPERASATSTPMVFNINFGNSTIYDTKRAATDAFTDQVIRTMSRRRRGAPQLPFRG
jgi:hypothetical protein